MHGCPAARLPCLVVPRRVPRHARCDGYVARSSGIRQALRDAVATLTGCGSDRQINPRCGDTKIQPPTAECLIRRLEDRNTGGRCIASREGGSLVSASVANVSSLPWRRGTSRCRARASPPRARRSCRCRGGPFILATTCWPVTHYGLWVTGIAGEQGGVSSRSVAYADYHVAARDVGPWVTYSDARGGTVDHERTDDGGNRFAGVAS